MKTTYKKMIAVCMVLVFTLACVSTAQARTLDKRRGWIAFGGTTKPTTTKKTVGGMPIGVRYTLPDVYYVGMRTPVKVTFLYDAKTKGLFGSYKNGKRYAYGKLYGKKRFKVFDLKLVASQSAGLDEFDAENASALSSEVRRKYILVRPNKTRTVTFWVTFDKCYQWPDPSLPGTFPNIPRSYYLDLLFGFKTPPAGYPCVWAPALTISWKGKIARKGFATQQNGSFPLRIIPLIPGSKTAMTPSPAAPVVPSETVEPTSPSGPTGSTGPTGPTG